VGQFDVVPSGALVFVQVHGFVGWHFWSLAGCAFV
jgi:hypothetical protein